VDPTPFHDKLWKRADMAAWDERWARLSVPARQQYLARVKAAAHARSQKPINRSENFNVELLKEWREAGLVREETRGKAQGFIVTDEAMPFTSRLRALARFHLLDTTKSSEFASYTSQCFASYTLSQVLHKIAHEQTGIYDYELGANVLERFVPQRRWPDWVAEFLSDPLAAPMIVAIEANGGLLPQARLGEHLPGHPPAEVRQTLDRLVNHLALVEDLDPQTLEIRVGLLPAVCADRQRAAHVPEDRPLKPVHPVEIGPEVGMTISDLRAVLLEMVGQPPRLKQNHELFQKEEERFVAALELLPEWLANAANPEEHRRLRVPVILGLAQQVGFAHAVVGANDALLLDLTDQGRQWLTFSREAQHARVYSIFRDPNRGNRFAYGDDWFLGCNISAVPRTANRAHDATIAGTYYGRSNARDRQPLRDAIYGVFTELPEKTFFAVEDFLRHAATGPRNPLLLAGEASQVIVHAEYRRIPPLEEHLEEVARLLLGSLLNNRLIGLGCVQVGRDSEGRLLMTRLPRLAVYFGEADVAPAAAEEKARVVVQPDFSVILIGMNPAPAAELAPFCERVRGRASQGSLTFRITRESVVRALSAGLKPEEVMARLERHASTPIPKNVATEVRGWCGWVRKVAPAPALLLHCPDTDTAERVVGALGKSAERVGETVVALAVKGLTNAVRQKLAGQGILLEEKRK
jgi:hypothetical protein